MLLTVALLTYLLITSFITFYVGNVLFHNGRPFLLRMLQSETLTDSVNRILLTGYYVVNLGYVSIMLTYHPPIETVSDVIVSLATSVGRIMLTLAVLHYLNITAITLWHKIKT